MLAAVIRKPTTSAPATTQAPTKAPTQAPTEAKTQAPTEAPTQAPTKAPTPAPTPAPVSVTPRTPSNSQVIVTVQQIFRPLRKQMSIVYNHFYPRKWQPVDSIAHHILAMAAI